MKQQLLSFLALPLLLSQAALHGQLPAHKAADPNPWNGTWKLDVKRSSPVAAEEGVPQAYRLTLGAATSDDIPIRWEIPELGEVCVGRTDGSPVPVHRTKTSPGLALAFRADADATLLYTVLKNGKVVGGGRMMLVDNGTAWVDLTWPDNRQDLASELVYVKH